MCLRLAFGWWDRQEMLCRCFRCLFTVLKKSTISHVSSVWHNNKISFVIYYYLCFYTIISWELKCHSFGEIAWLQIEQNFWRVEEILEMDWKRLTSPWRWSLGKCYTFHKPWCLSQYWWVRAARRSAALREETARGQITWCLLCCTFTHHATCVCVCSTCAIIVHHSLQKVGSLCWPACK